MGMYKFMGMAPPEGLDEDERLATPRVAPRGGLPPPPPPDVDSDDNVILGSPVDDLPPEAMPPLSLGHPVLLGFAGALQAEYRDGEDGGVGNWLDALDWDDA